LQDEGRHVVRGWVAFGCIAGLGLALVSCSRRQPAEEPAPREPAPRRGGTLILGTPEEPEVLDSILMLSKGGQLINNALFSRFVIYDDSLRLVPDLLVEIPTLANGGISPDERTYTYRLRRDARWHDGVPLTSADVEFTYRVIMHPEAGAETQQGFDIVDRVETPDSFTVVFHLREPYASFVSDSFSDEDVLPRHLLESHLGPQFRQAPFHRAPVGSGPFRFQEWVAGSHLTVTRFDAYHGGAPALDAITFKFVPEASTAAVQLRSGDLQGFDQIEAAEAQTLQQVTGLRLLRTPSLNYEHVDFNCRHPLLADARVRRALAHATDRDAIAAHVYDGAEAARADQRPLSPYYAAAADTASRFDLGRARALLAAAGWRDADGDGIVERDGKPLRFELCTTAGRPARERALAVLQQQWRAAGVEVTTRLYNAAALFGSPESGGVLRRGAFGAALFGWGQTPDPSAMQVVYGSDFAPPNGQNMGRYANPRLDSLVALGARVADPSRRIPIYRAVESILMHDVPVIPLVWQVEIDVMTSRLHGFRPNPLSGDTWNAQAWWLDEAL
jgi:peptide/nickel transport system substrate-binding protein